MSEVLLWGAAAGLILLLHVWMFALGLIFSGDDLDADDQRWMTGAVAGLAVFTWALLAAVAIALAHLP